jgi:hypothetical protein
VFPQDTSRMQYCIRILHPFPHGLIFYPKRYPATAMQAPRGKGVISSPATRHGGAWGERRYSSYSFTTTALDEGEWSASRPGRAFTPGERTPGTHCTGGWVGPRADLDTEDRGKNFCPHRKSNPNRPVVQPVVRHYTA